MNRRRSKNVAAHPLVLGTIALIVVVGGLWVSFNSTKGLPLVPTYQLTVEVPNAGQLTTGADVTIAGFRVGQVTEVTPIVRDNSEPAAGVKLTMSQGTDPIPVDSKFSIKLSGSLGRKTVVIEPGVSEETYPDDSLVTLDEDGRPPGDEFVDVDEVLNTFDAPARTGTKSLLEAYGLGLAGRGDDLSIVIARLPAVLRDLEPVMRTLGDSETNLAGFIAAMDGFWGELAPVSDELAALTVDLDTTFGALASVATPFIQETIVQTPETLEVATASLKRTRPFLRASTTLFAELEPATANLETASPVLADAFAAGARNLPFVPGLSDRLIVGLDDLASFSDAEPVRPGVQRVTATADALAPFVNFLAPAETRCAYLSLLIRNLASTFKEDTANGTAARVGAVVHGVDTNSERGPSNSIYPEPPSKALGPTHSNPYPHTMAPGQPDECEAGNEPYVTNRPVIGNVPGVQDSETEELSLP